MEKTKKNMITISGGIISKQIGSSITYKLICDKCGIAESSERTVTITKGVTEISTKKCSNCGYNQIIKMKYIIDNN